MAKITVDKALLKRAQKGDRRAFDLLCQPHYGIIFAHCLRKCRDASMAEDCTQETFFKAWKGLAKFRGDSSLLHWLKVIASNVISTAYRKLPNWVQVEEMESVVGGENPHPEVDRDLEAAMAQLPQGARKVFRLYSIFGFGHREIAKITGTAEGTSKAQLFRARKLLTNFLSIRVALSSEKT